MLALAIEAAHRGRCHGGGGAASRTGRLREHQNPKPEPPPNSPPEGIVFATVLALAIEVAVAVQVEEKGGFAPRAGIE